MFDQKDILGILDLSSAGYYKKKKQGILQQNLSKYYRFESAEVLCEQLNKCINTLKKGKEEMKNKCDTHEFQGKSRELHGLS